MFWLTTNIIADSKAQWIIDYIISKWSVTLPELMKVSVNWERLASVSTHISDWMKYAEKLGYKIVNTTKHTRKSCESSYKAIII